MQISWGIKIGALYTGFVLMIVFMVYKASTQKVDLVADDYYARELKYQRKIDAENAALPIHRDVTINVSELSVELNIPQQGIEYATGEVVFFNPSDASRDLKFPFKANKEGKLHFPADKFSKGRYKVQISWRINAAEYYLEKEMKIP